MSSDAKLPQTIVLVDDQIAVRELTCLFLHHRLPGCQVVAEAGIGQEAFEAVAKHHAGVIVADIFFRDLSPVDFLEQCHSQFPGTRLVAFTRWGQMTMVRKLIAAGVNAVVAKDDSLEILHTAVSAVLAGGYYLAPSVEKSLYQERAGGADLTDRELTVLRLIAEGIPTKEVGARLDISFHTAVKHRERIMQKLHLHDVVALTRYAIRNGLAAL